MTNSWRPTPLILRFYAIFTGLTNVLVRIVDSVLAPAYNRRSLAAAPASYGR